MPKSFVMTVTPSAATVTFTPSIAANLLTTVLVGGTQVIISDTLPNNTYNYSATLANYLSISGSIVINGVAGVKDELVALKPIPVNGTLVLTIIPAVNGVAITPTPAIVPEVSAGGVQTISLIPGNYTFTISAAGYYPQDISVTIVGGLTTSRTVLLEKLPTNYTPPNPNPQPPTTGDVVIYRPEPAGTNIYNADGTGPVPFGVWDRTLNDRRTIVGLPPGSYLAGVNYNNQGEKRKPFTIVAGNTVANSNPATATFTTADWAPPPPPPGVTVVPQTLSPFAADSVGVPGPMRGANRNGNFNNVFVETEIPGYDYYDNDNRYKWTALETSQGNYTTGINQIKADLDKLTAQGGRGLGLAISLHNPDPGGDNYPSWLPYEFINENGVPEPQWNSRIYIDAVKNLYAALGQAFANEKRIEWVDARTWGHYGEGHAFRSSPPYSTLPTLAVKKELIDSLLSSWPNHILLGMTDDKESVEYLMAQTANAKWRAGLRRDSFPWPGFNNNFINDFQTTAWSLEARDRWKNAPFIIESSFGNQDWANALSFIQTLHISANKDSNHGNVWTTWNVTDRNRWLSCIRGNGYLFSVPEATFPTAVSVGSTIQVTLKWLNSGVAPLYKAYTVKLILGSVTTSSGVTLKGLLPATPITQTDSMNLTGLAAGTYTLYIQITDNNNLTRPLQIDMVGKTSDIKYPLGTIVVS